MNEELVTKAELTSQLGELRVEFKTEIHLQITELRTEILERLEKVETTLLSEFRKYAIRSEARLRVNEVSIPA